jgi:nitroimidazol reductase NimA-like FMN-containing flavoprotein (pyridoxamine 5'-phosphate oxidase superfamily)/GNAT superfamily N-acetyltransferase
MEHKTSLPVSTDDSSGGALGPGPRSKVKRHGDRARYDTETVHAIIDAALYCHVSFVIDGQPFALPTAHARIDNLIYLHGAAANRMFRTVAQGGPVCLTFTLIDGLVMARSAFHHSMNYRSVAALGAGVEVTDEQEKRRALDALVNHVAEGRAGEVIAPTPEELKSTLVVRVPIDEASAKVRAHGVVDLPEHVARGTHWAGVIPLSLTTTGAVRDALLPVDLPPTAPIAQVTQRFQGPVATERLEGDLLFSSDKARLDVALIHRFLCDESYWAKGVSLARVQKSIDASLCFGVYRLHDGKCAQIAYARVLHDGGRFGYLGDVFVRADERGHGISKRLVQFVLDHPEVRDLDRLLLGTADAHALYSRYGFVQAPPDRYMVKANARIQSFR